MGTCATLDQKCFVSKIQLDATAFCRCAYQPCAVSRMTSCHSPKTASGNTYHKPLTKTLSNNSYYSNITNKFRRETLFEHGSEIWRTRRKQRRRRDKRRGGTGAQNTYTFLLMKSSATQKLWMLLASFLMVR